MQFTKMHGAGNDFVVVGDLENQLDVSPELARAVCDRHFGVGADALIRIGRSESGRFFMDYRNNDGSLAEMCGNGVRVVAKWLADRGFADGDVIDVETRGGVKPTQLFRTNGLVTSARVDMGPPAFDQVVEQLGDYEITAVSMGNPHAVLFVEDVNEAPLREIGQWIQAQKHRFPDGVNVEVANVAPDGIIDERTFERGVGETLACGTGACATAVAAQLRGLVGERVLMNARGGELVLEWTPGQSVYMTGPAVEVFSGELNAHAGIA